MLIIETHERHTGDENLGANIQKIMTERDFRVSRNGENHVYVR